MRILSLVIGSIIVAGISLPGGTARAVDDDPIARLIETYGGDKLVQLSSLSGTNQRFVTTTIRTPAPGEEETAYRMESFALDIPNGRATSEFVFVTPGRTAHRQRLFDGGQGYLVDYDEGYFSRSSASNIYGVIGSVLGSMDVMLVWQLSQMPDQAEYLGREDYQGTSYDLVRFPFPGSTPLTLYIDVKTGLVSRMTVENPPSGTVQFAFRNYAAKDGFTFARTTEVDVLPNLIWLLDNRELQFNSAVDDAEFAVPDEISAEPQRVDMSEKIVNRIAEGVYQVGAEGAYSLFVDAGEFVIGVGSQAGAAERFQDFKAATKIDKPLRFQVVTLHHDEQIAGLDGLNRLQPKLVTVDDNVLTIRDSMTGDLPDERLLLVDEKLVIGSGGANPVEVYEISTSFVTRYLLFYLPAQKTAFVVDHLFKPYVDSVSPGNKNTVDFAQEIDRLGLDVERLVSSTSPALMTRADLDLTVKKYDPQPCRFNRPICTLAR